MIENFIRSNVVVANVWRTFSGRVVFRLFVFVLGKLLFCEEVHNCNPRLTKFESMGDQS